MHELKEEHGNPPQYCMDYTSNEFYNEILFKYYSAVSSNYNHSKTPRGNNIIRM